MKPVGGGGEGTALANALAYERDSEGPVSLSTGSVVGGTVRR